MPPKAFPWHRENVEVPMAGPGRAVQALFLGAFVAGCMGDIGSAGSKLDDSKSPNDNPGDPSTNPPIDPGITAACGGPPPIGAAPIRRLSREEYWSTLRDLFTGIDVGRPPLAPDQETNGFENRAKDLFATSQNVSDFNAAAADVVARVLPNLAKILPCTAKDATCAGQFIDKFGLRAFRRPLATDEKTRYLDFFRTQMAAIDFTTAIGLVIEGMLQSPNFLYRPEFGTGSPTGDGRLRVTGYEMASRLSYFLWGTMPDDKLLTTAATGLTTDDQVLVEAERMASDPRARTQMINFHRQWLAFDHINEVYASEGRKDARLYPAYSDGMVSAMREEATRFTGRAMFDGARTLKELLTSRDTFVNATLADVYGVPRPTTWAPVTLPANQRGGILTQAAFLASHAHAVAGSPPLRAVFVMNRLLCFPPLSPPPDADTSPPTQAPGSAARTNRQLFEERVKAGGTCIGCHNLIDPIGFTFENYDAIGKFRTMDNGIPVDAKGALSGTDVDGPVSNGIELSSKLADSQQAQSCMTNFWFEYAVGRDRTEAEACKVTALTKTLKDAGGDVRRLQVALVRSPDFLYRKAN